MHKLLMQLAVISTLTGVKESYGDGFYSVADENNNQLFACPLEVKAAYDNLTNAIGKAYPEADTAEAVMADDGADTK